MFVPATLPTLKYSIKLLEKNDIQKTPLTGVVSLLLYGICPMLKRVTFSKQQQYLTVIWII